VRTGSTAFISFAIDALRAARALLIDRKWVEERGACLLGASSLGSAFGVAISAAIYTAASHIPAHLVPHFFFGRQNNIAIRFGGGLGLLFNVFMCLFALISIIVAVPDTQPAEQRDERPQVPASPSFGS
jgi:MFS transporter, DHA2 family, multidrug resistance protein